MMRTMMEPGARRQGRTGWPTTAGLPDGRAALLAALDAYRRGAAEAPVVCKQGMGSAAGGDVLPATRLPRCARNDSGWAAGLPRRSAARNGSGWGGDGESVVEDAVAGPLVFVASTGEVDRHGDTVAPEGWRLEAYRDNPVVLWAHDYGEPAIGRAEAVWSDGRALRARLEFAPTEFAGQVERLYRQGYQRGVSVGFRPLRFEERRDPLSGAFLGIRFLEQELLEISAVPVPANGGALLAEDGIAATFALEAREPAVAAGRNGTVDEVVGLLRGLRG